MVKSRAKVSGLGNSRERSCEHIKEGDQALSHRGRSKEPQQPLWSDRVKISFLTSSLAINQVNGSYVAKAQQVDTQGALRPYRLISRSSLCFVLDNFHLPRLCVYLGMSWTTSWVWGCYAENKTLRYMTCFSVWHTELYAEKLFSAIDISSW